MDEGTARLVCGHGKGLLLHDEMTRYCLVLLTLVSGALTSTPSGSARNV